MYLFVPLVANNRDCCLVESLVSSLVATGSHSPTMANGTRITVSLLRHSLKEIYCTTSLFKVLHFVNKLALLATKKEKRRKKETEREKKKKKTET